MVLETKGKEVYKTFKTLLSQMFLRQFKDDSWLSALKQYNF